MGVADAAGEGLPAGLGLLTGGGMDDEGLAVVGEVELFTGSVAQPAANMIDDDNVRSSNAMRLILVVFGILIFSSFEQD